MESAIINSLIYSYEENIEEVVINKTYYLKGFIYFF